MPSRKRRRESDAPAVPPAGPAAAAPGDDVDRACWLCSEPHVRATRSGAHELARCGCACRGYGAGWAHMPCIVRFAQANPISDRWTTCPTCKQQYSFALVGSLARARVRLAEAACAPFRRAKLDGAGGARAVAPEGDSEGEFEAEDEFSSAMHLLGLCLISSAQYTEARRILEQLVARGTERWGANDERTLCSRIGLVQALVDMGDFAVARPISEHLVEACAEHSGPKSQNALDAQAVHAQVLVYVGEGAEALRLWTAIVAERVAQGGPTHEETIRAKHMHAEALWKLGDAAAAQALCEEILAYHTRLVGAAHEDTLNIEGALAEIQVAVGLDLPAAEQTLIRCVCVCVCVCVCARALC